MGKAKGASRGRIPPRERSSAQETSHTRRMAALDRGDLGEVAFVHKAMSLGFVVAKPYGHNHPYDFLVDGGKNLWKVQVKSCSFTRNGLYMADVCHSRNNSRSSYTETDFDFLAVYIVPEDTWYILPVREAVGRHCLLFRSRTAKHKHRRDPYAHYCDVWDPLREPDGLTFG